VLDDLSVGLGIHAWVGEDPTLVQYTIPVTYYINTKTKIHPYFGGFYRYSDYSGNYQSYSSVGAKAGVAYRVGSGYAGMGYVYEKNLENDVNSGYPEFILGIVF
jgi:hypothetical protein